MRLAPFVVALAALLGAPAAARADLVTVTAFDPEFTPAQRDKLVEALALANRVLASDALRARVAGLRDLTYTRADGAQVHRDLVGRTYALRFEAVARYAVNFFGIKRVSAMVASSGEGSGEITFNTLRMHEFPASTYAGTILHELCHIAGYSHRGNRPTRANLRSAPYRVGELGRELAEALPAPAPAPSPTPAPGPTPGLTGGLSDAPASRDDGEAPQGTAPPGR